MINVNFCAHFTLILLLVGKGLGAALMRECAKVSIEHVNISQ